ncbi:MNIO family bufferin maturase [Vibrio sp. JPW-9-11-11]|uniref:MNIO family bufferin maturase n=1 Tax=Vibrio sp. JPW-9-11-11 TaxID=1416532 RepID=UPI0034E86EEC
MTLYHQQVGVGLRTPHLNFFSEHPTPLSWLEVHSENYFQPNSDARHQLRRIAKDYQISCHGIGLSLGSVDRVNRHHLGQLQNLVDEFNPFLISDHLSWSQNGGHYFNDLLPLPYTEEALAVFCRNVMEVQDALKRPILIENPSSYLRYQHSTITEWEFLRAVQQRTECRLLLDLNNIHVSAFNHGFDRYHYLDAIPANAVDEIHLAGFTVKALEQGELWIDTHSQPVSDEVWQLFDYWLRQYGTRHTLIEWDIDIPAAPILLAEAEKASDYLHQQNNRQAS